MTIDLSLDEESAALARSAAGWTRFGDSAKDLGSRFAKLGGMPAKMIVGPALGASEALRSAAVDIRAQTGATGAQLDALTGTLRDVQADTGASIKDAGAAVVSLNRGLGLTGDALRTVADQLIRAVRGTGGDLRANAEAVVDVMHAWGVDAARAGETAEMLRSAARQGGVDFAAFAAKLQGAAPTLRAAGLTFGDSAAALADLAKRGIPVDDALGALTKGLTNLAKSGERDIALALRRSIESIRNARTPAEAAQIAVDLFGKRGVAIADAIRAGGLRLDGGSALAIPEAGPPLERLAISFGELRAAVQRALEPLGRAAARLVLDLVEPLTAGARALVSVGQAFAALPQAVQVGAVIAASALALAGPAALFVGGAVALVTGPLMSAVTTIGGTRLVAGALVAALVSAGAGIASACKAVEEPAGRVASRDLAGPVSGAGGAVRASAAAVGELPGVVRAAGAGGLDASKRDIDARAADAVPAPVEIPRFPPLPRMPPLARPAFERPSLSAPALVTPVFEVPPPPVFQLPAWARDFDWQGSINGRASPGISAGGSPAAPMYRHLGDVSTAEMAAADMLAMLTDMARIKPMAINAAATADELARQLAAVKRDWTVGDSMRLTGVQMGDYFERLQVSGILPLGLQTAMMPGSWLASNTPEAWMKRATETDRVIGENRARDQYWMDFTARRDEQAIAAWERNNAALMSMPNSRATVVMAEDVARAAAAGWQATVSAWAPPSTSFANAPAPAAPPPNTNTGQFAMSFYGSSAPAPATSSSKPVVVGAGGPGSGGVRSPAPAAPAPAAGAPAASAPPSSPAAFYAKYPGSTLPRSGPTVPRQQHSTYEAYTAAVTAENAARAAEPGFVPFSPASREVYDWNAAFASAGALSPAPAAPAPAAAPAQKADLIAASQNPIARAAAENRTLTPAELIAMAKNKPKSPQKADLIASLQKPGGGR